MLCHQYCYKTAIKQQLKKIRMINNRLDCFWLGPHSLPSAENFVLLFIHHIAC